MSELTICNYCSLRGIRRRADQNGLKVTLRAEQGGTTVYVHPLGVTEFPRRPDGEPGQYWSGWMMEITDHCVC